VGSNLSTSETGRRVETDTVSTGGTVNLDFTCEAEVVKNASRSGRKDGSRRTGVGSEALRRVFGRDAALNSVTALGDGVLAQAKLGKSSTGTDLWSR